MILESILSNSYLLSVSSSCIYLLSKHCYGQFSKLQYYFISGTIGITAFNIRSTVIIIHDIFIRKYTIIPEVIENECREREEMRKRPFRNQSIFERTCTSMGLAGLIYAFYDYNNARIAGSLIITSFVILEIICAWEYWKYNQEINCGNVIEDDNYWRKFLKIVDSLMNSLWITLGVSSGWLKGNFFCLLAFIPYTILILMMSSDEFDENPGIQNSFNNSMITVYIILMTEAIRQSPSKLII